MNTKTDQEIAECAAKWAADALILAGAKNALKFVTLRELILEAITQAKAGLVEWRDVILEAEPNLKNEGVENFDGYFVHWDEIIKACGNGAEGYSQSPIELIIRIIDERDQLRAQLLKWEEREASVCSEDHSFEETISTLRAQLAEVTHQKEMLREERDKWKEWADPEKTSLKVQRLVQRAEKAEKSLSLSLAANAEMREALQNAQDIFKGEYGQFDEQFFKALSSNAGKGYVKRDELDKANALLRECCNVLAFPSLSTSEQRSNLYKRLATHLQGASK